MGINLMANQPSQLVPIYVALEKVVANTQAAFTQAYMDTYAADFVISSILTTINVPSPAPPPKLTASVTVASPSQQQQGPGAGHDAPPQVNDVHLHDDYQVQEIPPNPEWNLPPLCSHERFHASLAGAVQRYVSNFALREARSSPSKRRHLGPRRA